MKTVVFNSVSGSPQTDAWHAWRKNGIGGSDAALIATDAGLCGKSTWMKKLHYLFQLKTGQIEQEDLSGNPAVVRGQRGEVPARDKYEQFTGNLVSPVFGEMDEYPFVRASLDGQDFSASLLVEIKCPSAKVHELAKAGVIVDYYVPQVIHQALVSWGTPDKWTDQLIHFLSYVPETDDFALVEWKLSETSKFIAIPSGEMLSIQEYANRLLQAEIAFWSSVTNELPPCGLAWMEAAKKYTEAQAKLDEAKKESEAARQVLINLLGDRKTESGGGVTATKTPKEGVVNYETLLNDLLVGKTPEEIEKYIKQFEVETVTTSVDYDKLISASMLDTTAEEIAAYVAKFKSAGTDVVTLRVSKAKPKVQIELAIAA